MIQSQNILYSIDLLLWYPIGSMYAIYGNIYHQYTVPPMLVYIPYMDPMGMILKSFHPHFVLWTSHVSGLAVPRIAISMDVMCASKQVILACPLGRQRRGDGCGVSMGNPGSSHGGFNMFERENREKLEVSIWEKYPHSRPGVRELRE